MNFAIVLQAYLAARQRGYGGRLPETDQPIEKPYFKNRCGIDFLIANQCAKNWYETMVTWDEMAIVRERGMIQSGDVVLDVGSHHGANAIAYSRLVGPRGRVYAFEPLPHNIDILRANLMLNDCNNVSVLPIAVSDKWEDVPFSLTWSSIDHEQPPDGIAGTPCARHWARANNEDDIMVPSTPLDNLGLEPNFIKIDVEGSEGNVLVGAVKTLKWLPHLQIEIHRPDQRRRTGGVDWRGLVDWGKYCCYQQKLDPKGPLELIKDPCTMDLDYSMFYALWQL